MSRALNDLLLAGLLTQMANEQRPRKARKKPKNDGEGSSSRDDGRK